MESDQNKCESTFTPSVNIIRDINVNLNYISTPNATKVFNQLISDYQTGIRAFNIIGAYGTGKSVFLWAFEKTINQNHSYFTSANADFDNLKGFTFLSMIGEYGSIRQSFAYLPEIGLTTKFKTRDIVFKLDNYYKSLHNIGKGLVIQIDEFGKFLEYAAKNNPEEELYFIQLLAEYVNDSTKNIFFLTTLHQDFHGYSRGLTIRQQNEWDKVKGRLKEVTFNEPVEQLLFLASERLNELNIGKKDINFSKLFEAIEVAKAFPLRDYFTRDFAEKLLPFDILSAAVLTLALQRYGQNERSLFSFIASNDDFGIRHFDQNKTPYYNLSSVYDYLLHNYYSYLTTSSSSHQTQWSAIRIAIEKVEGFDDNISDVIKLVKTIGLLNIFASASAKINFDFLCDYGKFSLGINEPQKIIKQLEGSRVIRFVKYSSRYILKEGTDLNIEVAIDDAGNFVEKVTSVVHHLNTHFDFPYISAKAAYYEKGTPRFFAFHLSESPSKLNPLGEVDGFINLIFSDVINEKEIIEISEDCEQAVLYGWYKNTHDIANALYEIEKIKKVKEVHIDDKIAVRELENILQHQIKLLNHYVLGNMFSDNSSVLWYFQGKQVPITDQKTFNRFLSVICDKLYPSTPIYRNEMVNKTRLSGVIATARKNFLSALIGKWYERDLGMDPNKFPPEKTIYLSLLKDTGIHRSGKDGYVLDSPTNNKTQFNLLWDVCNTFLKSTTNGKRDIQQLTDKLFAKPFKLKQGFIDFWIPVFLFSKREEFALFNMGIYLPNLTQETLELVSKNPKEFEIKAFETEGVKSNLFNSYRKFLNQSEKEEITGKSFIETIRPFLVFYKQLPEYAKNTQTISHKAISLRQAILQAKDPEETFFVDFPKALGYNFEHIEIDSDENLVKYVEKLEEVIREIRTCYDKLITRTELFIQQEIIGSLLPYPEYKKELQNRFNKLKKHLLLPHQKVFYQRINSDLDDNKGWLNSISQACIGKTLEFIVDEEEALFREKFKDIIHELDNLCELSKGDFDEEKEIAFKFEITSFIQGLKKNLVRLPKSKNKDLLELSDLVKSKLSNDKQLNIATLAKLLEELLKNEKES